MTPAWEACFQARDNHEAIVVDRYIEQDLPRTEFIVAWVEKIIAKGWLTAPSLLRWIGDDQAAALRHLRQLPVERRLAWLTQWRRHPDELMLLLRENPDISPRDFCCLRCWHWILKPMGGGSGRWAVPDVVKPACCLVVAMGRISTLR